MVVNRPMTPEWEAEICDDLRSGMPCKEILGKHNISQRRLQRIQEKHGLLRKPKVERKKPTPPTPEEIWEQKFREEWEKATQPIKDKMHKRIKKRGVYWWNGQADATKSGDGVEKKNKQDIWRGVECDTVRTPVSTETFQSQALRNGRSECED